MVRLGKLKRERHSPIRADPLLGGKQIWQISFSAIKLFFFKQHFLIEWLLLHHCNHKLQRQSHFQRKSCMLSESISETIFKDFWFVFFKGQLRQCLYE
jgi:hypothetical protein